jgi:hypothetical protein
VPSGASTHAGLSSKRFQLSKANGTAARFWMTFVARTALTLRVTATDVDGASAVVEQQFKAQ